MILEFEQDTTCKDPAHKWLAKEAFGNGVEVRGLIAEVTLQCKKLNETMDAEELVTAF